MSLSPDEKNRKNAGKLKINLFSREIAKILKIGFTYFLPLSHDKMFAKHLIEITMIFFDLFEDYAKHKIIKI